MFISTLSHWLSGAGSAQSRALLGGVPMHSRATPHLRNAGATCHRLPEEAFLERLERKGHRTGTNSDAAQVRALV